MSVSVHLSAFRTPHFDVLACALGMGRTLACLLTRQRPALKNAPTRMTDQRYARTGRWLTGRHRSVLYERL